MSLYAKSIDILNTLDPEDQDAFYLKLASEKARNINQMQYGSDSPLLPLYTLIKSAPVSIMIIKCTYIYTVNRLHLLANVNY